MVSREAHAGTQRHRGQGPWSKDIGSYDLMVVRSKLFERNGVNTPTPAQVALQGRESGISGHQDGRTLADCERSEVKLG